MSIRKMVLKGDKTLCNVKQAGRNRLGRFGIMAVRIY
jgi:hypothetical protein